MIGNFTGNRPQFVHNKQGVVASYCKDLGESFYDMDIDVSGTEFRDHDGNAILTFNSDVTIWQSSLYNNWWGVYALEVDAEEDIEIIQNDFSINSPSSPPGGWQTGIYLLPTDLHGTVPLPNIAVNQNDFHGFHDAPARYGVYLFPAPCDQQVPEVINAQQNYWGCPDWSNPLFSGGPVVNCDVDYFPPGSYPPCPDISIVTRGIDFRNWSPIPLH